MFVCVDWAEAQYEVDFLKKCLILVGLFSKMIFFAIGVPVRDLGAKIAAKFSQQRFLDIIFLWFWGWGGSAVTNPACKTRAAAAAPHGDLLVRI